MRKPTTGSLAASAQRGLSLIELLIAIALGVLLLLGLVQIFSGVRNTFAATESLSRIQENGRFALEFLRRDARMTGHMGCRNETWHFPTRAPIDASSPLTYERTTEPAFNNLVVAANTARDDWYYTLRLDRPLEVYEYTAEATAPGSDYTITDADPTPVAAAGSWTPALPDALNITGDALPGSDVVVMRYLDEEALPAAGALSGLTALPVRAEDVTAGVYVPGALYGVTDCNISALFNVASINSGASPPTLVFNALPNVERTDAAGTTFYMPQQISIGEGSMLHRYHVVAYYVGQGVEGPALKRRTLLQTGYPTADDDEDYVLGPAEEVVEGVEMMQVLLGFDELGEGGSATVKDDSADRYLTASELTALSADVSVQDENLRRVISLRVSLLLRGNQGRSGAVGPASIIVGETRVTPPADGRLREVYETVMSIRNRNRA